MDPNPRTDALARQKAPPIPAQVPSPPSAPAPYLEMVNIHKNFGPFIALHDVHLKVYPGEFVCLLGPSGCGKTTLLRIIAGLERQTQGRVIQAGKDVSTLPPSKRDFGIVFQSYALFPNLTANQNIAYGLQNTRRDRREIQARVEELLETVGLQGFGHKFPPQLSGGQQQRVALARALALSPSLLLLDEPLSALDAKVREKLRGEITLLQKRLGITTVMVTHDQSEALAMADRVVVMDRGVIAQVGTPHAIYQNPGTPFVADFIGVMNFLPGVTQAPTRICCGNLTLITSNDLLIEPHRPVTVAIRPEDVRILEGPGEGTNGLTATVKTQEFLGSGYRLCVVPEANPTTEILVDISSQQSRSLTLDPGRTLYLQLPPELIRVYPVEG